MNVSMWAAHVEVRRRTEPTPDELDDLMEVLGPFGAAFGMSPRGWLGVRLTVPAEGLRQAAMSATSLVQAADPRLRPLALEVMPEDEWEARQAFALPWRLSDVIGTNEAADMIGVSRQRVLQMVAEGKLPGLVVGHSYVIPKQSVEQWLDQREMDGR